MFVVHVNKHKPQRYI